MPLDTQFRRGPMSPPIRNPNHGVHSDASHFRVVIGSELRHDQDTEVFGHEDHEGIVFWVG